MLNKFYLLLKHFLRSLISNNTLYNLHSTVVLLLRDALNEIFDMCDLTGNELWSREEFRLYNLLTSDQELDDAEWQVVEGLSVFSRHLQYSSVLLTTFVQLCLYINLSFLCKYTTPLKAYISVWRALTHQLVFVKLLIHWTSFGQISFPNT